MLIAGKEDHSPRPAINLGDKTWAAHVAAHSPLHS
jgi:hypothetical protein